MAQRMLSLRNKSSNIDSVFYDPDTQTLQVNFGRSGVYEYTGVSEETALGFESAESAGKYLHQNIKGQYETKKL